MYKLFTLGKQPVRLLQVVVPSLLWCYIIYRAATIEITQDEAYSYFLVKTNYWKAMAGTANTHWLNSLFIRLFLWLPGADAPWKLRMLSIVSWPVYVCSALLFSSLFKKQILGIFFFLFAILNPFLIFYFSLARGYAAACTFVMLTLWLAGKALDKEDVKPNTWFVIFGCASVGVIANFSAFYFFMAVVAAYLLNLLCRGQLRTLWRSGALKLWCLVFCISLFAIADLLFIKYYTGDLEFGASTNLIQSIFGSLVYTADYITLKPALLRSISYFFFLLFSITAGFAAYDIWVAKKVSARSYLLLVGAVVLLLNGCFHIFFKTPYLTERTALTLYPVFLCSIFYFLDAALQRVKMARMFAFGMMLLVAGLLSINFYKSYSPFYFKEWPVQTNTREALDYLQASGAKNVGLHLWHYSVLVNYYKLAFPNRYNFDYHQIPVNALAGPTGTASFPDFQYLLLAPPDTALANLAGRWEVQLAFKASGAKLVCKADSTSRAN